MNRIENGEHHDQALTPALNIVHRDNTHCDNTRRCVSIEKERSHLHIRAHSLTVSRGTRIRTKAAGCSARPLLAQGRPGHPEARLIGALQHTQALHSIDLISNPNDQKGLPSDMPLPTSRDLFVPAPYHQLFFDINMSQTA